MKTGRRVKLASLAVVLTVLAAGCSPNGPEKFEKIVLGTETVPHSSPVWIAENKGYFREQHLDVRIEEFDSGRTALRSMLNSEGIDMVTAAQTPVVFNSFSRNDFAIVGGMVYSDNDVKMLARQDRGIRGPADLKGKSVGITIGSSGHFFLGLFTAYHHMRASELRIIDMEPGRLSQALVDGQVDAIATWEPHVYMAKKFLGNRALLLSEGGLYREDFYFVGRKEFIKNHFEALKRFLRAIEHAEEFIRKNNEEAMDIVGRRLKMDREILKVIWDSFRFGLFLDQPILTSLEDEARWSIRNGLAEGTKVPNYLDYLHSEALRAVKPEAVAVAASKENL